MLYNYLKKRAARYISEVTAPEVVKNKFRKGSYAQCGEDLIVRHIFEQWRMSTFRYLDIGAHHPFYLSNTALFYELGCRGVNVEPDTDLIGKFRKHRPEDVNLNVGIAQEAGELDFYVISTPTLNTFSREEVENYKREGDHRVVRVDKVKVLPVRDIIGQHCGGVFPEFLTVDAEGIDELVMQSIDFEHNYPLVICVETVSYSNTGKGEKKTGLIEFIAAKGYIVFADTNVNTIFVRSDKWVR